MAFNLTDKPLSNGLKLLRCIECQRDEDPIPLGGQGQRKILLVFEHPTSEQVATKDWFRCEATVFRELAALGVDLRNDLYVTAALPCGGGNKNLRSECCITTLEKTIKQTNPILIIAVGSVAAGAVLRLYNPAHFKPNSATGQYYGHCIPLIENGWRSWFMSVMSDVEVHADRSKQLQRVASNWVHKQLEYALEHTERPDQVEHPSEELLYDSAKIIEALDEAMQSKYVAFDYETNCLQPESTEAKILCAAISYGDSNGPKRTVAFPMSSKEVERKWCEFLQSPVYKIGANIKYEHRWSSVLLDTPVVNWCWDICVAARIFDCYSGNSGLKFQTFVHFGVVGYDDSVEPYMKGGEYNRLDQAPVTDLLTYNAYDAYYTYLTAKAQYEAFHMTF